MKQNEGTIDRIIRFILGLILIYFGFSMQFNTVGIILTVIGIVLIFTAVTGFCALYTLLKISTK
ncbi:YgaP family membrane protein [Thermodesulfobium sp.]